MEVFVTGLGLGIVLTIVDFFCDFPTTTGSVRATTGAQFTGYIQNQKTQGACKILLDLSPGKDEPQPLFYESRQRLVLQRNTNRHGS